MRKVIFIAGALFSIISSNSYSQTGNPNKGKTESSYYKTFKKNYPDFSMNNIESLTITKEADSVILLAYKITTKGLKKTPPAFPIMINNVKAGAEDTGKFPDAIAGDGIYTILGKAKSPENFLPKTVYKIKNKTATLVSPVAKGSGGLHVVCHVVVDCTEDLCTRMTYCELLLEFSLGYVFSQ